MPTIGFSLLGIASASLIAMTYTPDTGTERIFRNSVLRFFGRYSYGIYVFHYTLDELLTGRIRGVVDAEFHSKAFGVFSGAVIVAIASVLVAVGSYHFYEKHFLLLKKYFSYQTSRAIS